MNIFGLEAIQWHFAQRAQPLWNFALNGILKRDPHDFYR